MTAPPKESPWTISFNAIPGHRYKITIEDLSVQHNEKEPFTVFTDRIKTDDRARGKEK